MDKKNRKILLIEDMEFIIDIFTDFLSENGYEILSANTGVKGLASFNQENPQLVLLDLRIPEMDGFEVLSRIREQSPELPVIVVSGTADINDAIKAIRLGAWDFITKPIMDMRVLGHAIEKALEKFDLVVENKRYREHLEELVLERTLELEKELALRKTAEESLKRSLQEKDVLLKEIHHRVKNNLQVISSLLHLQSSYISDKKAFEMFIESENRVKSLALIHEKMYQTENLACIDLKEYIRDLIAYLFSMYNVHSSDIELTIDMEDIFFGVDIAIPCGLIINELVTNSLKYAFPEGEKHPQKRISIIFFRNGEKEHEYVLVVGDNGVGFDWNNQAIDKKSLGVTLIKTLVDQLDGKIVMLEQSQGAVFKIIFSK